MAIATDLFGVTYQIPETKERPWGAIVTALLRSLATSANQISSLSGGVPSLVFQPTNTTLANGGTLAWTYPWHRISGSGGAVTLSSTSSIADGAKDGQLLFLSGSSASNTVTITDGSNVQLNGAVLLGLNEGILLGWNSSIGDWVELFRST